jgi:hypothetical protein
MTHLTALLTTIKTSSWKFLSPILLLLAPVKFVIILVGLCILIDTAFGIWSAKKTGKKITSSRFSAVIGKMFIYQAVVLLFFGIDVIILGDFIKLFIGIPYTLTKIVATVLIVNEGLSVDEKLKNVNPGKGIWYFVKRMLGVAKKLKREAEDLGMTNEK